MIRTTRFRPLHVAGLLLFCAMGMGLMFAQGGAQAQEYGGGGTQGALTVSDDTPRPGQTIRASGAGMAPNAPVTLTLNPTLGQTTADSAGRFSLDVTIPGRQAPGPYTLTARGAAPGGGTRVLTAPVTVTDSGSGTGGDRLARTGGSSFLPLTILGLVLIGAGAAVVVLLRRRHLQRSP